MKKILLKHVSLLDGTKDMVLQKDQDILIEGETIAKIGTNLSCKEAKKIDCKGKYVTPGLINLHAHLPASGKVGKTKSAGKQKLVAFMKSNSLLSIVGVGIGASAARTALLSGTTTVRAVGGVGNFDSLLRNQINKGRKVGARLIVADEAICPVDGHMSGTVSQVAHNVKEALQYVEDRCKNHVDFIKIMITGGVLDCKTVGHPGDLKMDLEMTKAICDRAHEHGLKVAAHVEGEEGMEVAIQGGVDTIEHGAPCSEKSLQKFIARGGILVTTLAPAIPFVKLDPKKIGYGNEAKINGTALFEGIVGASQSMLKLGGTVGLGTDAGCPFITHYDMWRELVYFSHFVKGVTPAFAIHTATEVNAQILGLENKIGTVQEGKVADLVLLNHNPLEDLSAYQKPALVIARGKVYTQKPKKFANIDEALDSVKL